MKCVRHLRERHKRLKQIIFGFYFDEQKQIENKITKSQTLNFIQFEFVMYALSVVFSNDEQKKNA